MARLANMGRNSPALACDVFVVEHIAGLEALLDVVETAYGGRAPHRFPSAVPEFEVELHLLPRRTPAGGEPPSVTIKQDGDDLYGIMDDCNYVRISPERHRALIVASADMLDRAYHLRYELIEFAVFILRPSGSTTNAQNWATIGF